MTDPTELVITAAFALVFVVFGVAAWRRYASQRSEGPPQVPGGTVPVWFYRWFDGFGLAGLCMIYVGLVLAQVRAGSEAEVVLKPEGLVVSITFQFLLAGAVVVMMALRVRVADWLGLRWKSWPWVFLIAPASVVVMWAVFGGLVFAGYTRWMESLGVETVQDTVKLLQESDDPVVLGLMGFAAVVAAPLCEEVVFRGYLYPVMKKFVGLGPAVFCSALLFSAAHGEVTALLPLFLFGGLLVLVYEKTGSLWASIAVHFCFNSATVAAQMLVRWYDLPLEGMP